jgi:hypothetical protein
MKDSERVIKEPLPIAYLENFSKRHKFGNLYFPNGTSTTIDDSVLGHRQAPLHISIQDFYSTLLSWEVNGKTLQQLGLVGIIATGNAVHYPGYTLKTEEVKRWLFRGTKKVIVKEYVTSLKPEFLILTEDKPIPEEYVARMTSRSALCRIESTRMNLNIRSVYQAVKGIRNQDISKEDGKREAMIDYISIDALTNGVPIFFGDARPTEEYELLLEKTNMYKDNPRTVEWHTTEGKWNAQVR